MAGDLSAEIIERVKDAYASEQSLLVAGHGSKTPWLPEIQQQAGAVLDVTGHSGIQAYQPEELVITARAGTSLDEINQTLAAQGQMLACDPPQFKSAGPEANTVGTLGGVVACGMSGPSRPWSGAVRDAILGVELVNGKGEYLKFGGQVMKNVAGYDVSRLQAGAWGNLGVLASISIRVHPSWQDQCTLVFPMSAEQAQKKCLFLAQQNLPLQGTCWRDGLLSLRLAGHSSGVAGAKLALGGEAMLPVQEKNFGLACVITMQTFFILPTAVSVSGGLSCRLRLPYRAIGFTWMTCLLSGVVACAGCVMTTLRPCTLMPKVLVVGVGPKASKCQSTSFKAVI